MNLCNHPLCGSCTWSTKSYPQQLNEKLEAINAAMTKHQANLQVTRILPSPQTDHYRNRMDFVINYQGKYGLREKGKWWSVINDHHCAIAHPAIEQVFHITRDWIHQSGLSYFDRKAHHGFLRYAVIRATADGQTMLILITSPFAFDHPELDSRPPGKTNTSFAVTCHPELDSGSPSESEQLFNAQIQKLTKQLPQTSIYHAINPTISDTSTAETYIHISGPEHLIETFHTPAGNIKYVISPSAFFQTNPSAAQLLLDTVLEMSSQINPPPAKGELDGVTLYTPNNNSHLRILDLYCGSGFFTLPLAALSHSVTGIELIDQAIQDANQNINLNSNILMNVTEVRHSDEASTSEESFPTTSNPPNFSAKPTEDLSWAAQPYDLVLLDPPRAGLHPTVLQTLMDMAPKHLIYVSCGYKNFARELATLQTNYQVLDSTAIDMFPHTPHVELVTHLTLMDSTSSVPPRSM